MIDAHGPKKSTLENFYHDFGGKKSDFCDIFSNEAILRREVNMGFLDTFHGPKGQFPAKNHISSHHIKNFRFLTNRIF